ncbi:glutathione S-transferase family protein [Aminobacter sp. Piv2-1]|uniref:glutathione S-transferase family protein n=1 Tax=Aminobacter sp. Piv2-1 TaxID=3031122 RepID=UPI0030ACE608
MFTLYGYDGSGSVAVEALLSELGLPFRLKIVGQDAHGEFSSDFKAISPRSQVPVLELPDGSVMTESGAMMIYLADLMPEAGLAPRPSDSRRSHYLRAIFFLAASTYPAYLRFFYPNRYSVNPNGAAGVKAAAEKDIWRDLSILGKLLGKSEWIGKTFSAADIYAAMLVSWCGDLALLGETEPSLYAHFGRVKQRRNAGKVFARNGL